MQFGGLIEAGTGSATVTISLEWLYELPAGASDAEQKAKDELDTEWGEKAYKYYIDQKEAFDEYYDENPGETKPAEYDYEPSISLKIELKATQI